MTRSSFTFGTIFIVLGVLLLLDRGGALDAWQVIGRWWPLAVVVAGAAQALTRPRNLVGGAILATIGGVLLLWTLGLANVMSVLWPVLLIGLGLWLVTRRSTGVWHGPDVSHVVASDDEIVLVFSDRNMRVDARPYGGQAVTTVFGDLDLDLRDVTIEGRVRMPVTTIFGDVDLVVPSGWRITVSGPELFGDVTWRTPVDHPPDAPELHLQVVCIFGDISIRSATPTVSSHG
jgi:predicted membrane protein